MIPEVCLFTNVHEIKQQYKQKPEIMFDKVICHLFELGNSEGSFEQHF